ncbi:unnamed protein product [Clavelina lepadiformis]|uniref:RGS domain-containing protein n=1 Tax=Clavelina lepadiformis TaxID=159417 RepID=A0ABP0F420_CLALP
MSGVTNYWFGKIQCEVHQNFLYRPRSLNNLSGHNSRFRRWKDYCDITNTWPNISGDGREACISTQGFKALMEDVNSGLIRLESGRRRGMHTSSQSLNLSGRTRVSGWKETNALHRCKAKIKKNSAPLQRRSKLTQSLREFSRLQFGALLRNEVDVRCEGKLRLGLDKTRAAQKPEAYEKTQEKLNQVLSWVQKNSKKAAERCKVKGKRRAHQPDKHCTGARMNTSISNEQSPKYVASTTSSVSLKEVLSNKVEMRMFRKFLTKELSEENLDFWLEVEFYKKQKPNKQQKLAPTIFGKYFSFSSPHEINIERKVRAKTEENLLCPDAECFDYAQCHVFRLMESDSFRRYLELNSR